MTGTPTTRTRRHGWAWLVSIVVVLALVVLAWFLGEWIARDLVTKTIRTAVVTELALPSDQDVRVDIAGFVLPQLVGGTFHDITVSSDRVPLQDTTADVAVDLHDVRYRDDGAMRGGTAVVTMDRAQLRGLLSSVSGFPVDTLGLAAPDVTATSTITAFGASVPVGLGLRPSAADGALVLTPDTLRLGSATVTAADLRARFGTLADPVLHDWRICVAQELPTGLTLSAVAVERDSLVARFDIAGAIAVDPSLREKGSCA